MANVSGKEVISFFKSADLEFAELVLEFAGREVEARVEARAKISANLKKARAARKPAGSASTEATATVTTAETAAPTESVASTSTPEQPPVRRGRPPHAHVPAPAHTAEATAAVSD